MSGRCVRVFENSLVKEIRKMSRLNLARIQAVPQRILMGLIALAFMFFGIGKPAMAQPAPGLSYLQVIAVKSTGFTDWDPVPDYLYLTNKDHRGPELIVVTKEIGYSSNYSQRALFNGSKMSLIREDAILNGRTVVGYIRYWYYYGAFTSGKFTYQASSINFPYSTWSDWISIK